MDIYSEDQSNASILIYEFLNQNIQNQFYLFGYAGTGKTFLISKIISQYLSDTDADIFICAPTHKALNVIETFIINIMGDDYFESDSCKIFFKTIHNKLKFRPYISTSGGTLLFRPRKNMQNKNTISIIFIDECSMISNKMVDSLDLFLENNNSKIIYMGDCMQLPPVGEKISKIFTKAEESYRYKIELKQIIRSEKTSIKDVCMAIRNWDKKSSVYKLLEPIYKMTTDKSFRLFRNNLKGEKKWVEYFTSQIKAGENSIILTWDNNTSNYYNNLIRKQLHTKNKLDIYEIGDYIMFNDYYKSISKQSFYYTSDVVKIITIQRIKKKLCDWYKHMISTPKSIQEKYYNKLLHRLESINNELDIICFNVEKIDTNCVDNIYVIDLSNQSEFYIMKTTMENHIKFFYNKYKSNSLVDNLWTIFREKYVEPYASICFGYSITAYKSQSSTYDNVYIHMQNMSTIRDVDIFHKALYTAMGRSRSALYLII